MKYLRTKDQQGFSFVELLLIIVIVGAVVIVGMRVANRQDDADDIPVPVATQKINNEQDLQAAEDSLNDINLDELDTSELDATEDDLL